MNEIILIGAGGHAKACIDVIEFEKKYKIAGLVDSNKTGKVNGYQILGNDDDLENLRKKYSNVLITFGQIKSAENRIKMFSLLKELNFNLPTIISPKSHVSRYSKISEGSIIMHHAIINADAEIGMNCIINNKALIEHDAVVGDYCHISTGSILNGDVKVGKKCFICSGAVLINSISIGDNCVIGAGKTIRKNLKTNSLVK